MLPVPQPYTPNNGRALPRRLGDLLYCEHIEGECVRCRRTGVVRPIPIVDKYGTEVTLNEVWRRMRCKECSGTARFPPRIVTDDPKAGPADNLRNYQRMKMRRPESEWVRLAGGRHRQDQP